MWSALGVMSSDVLHLYEHSELLSLAVRRGAAERDLRRARAEALAQLKQEGFAESDIELTRIAEMKFSLQIHQARGARSPPATLTEADMDEQQRAVHRRATSRSIGEGAAFPGAGTQIGTCRVVRPRARAYARAAGDRGSPDRAGVSARGLLARVQRIPRDRHLRRRGRSAPGARSAVRRSSSCPVTTVVLPPGAARPRSTRSATS